MAVAARNEDTCLGSLALDFPEPADAAYVARVRALISEADLEARGEMEALRGPLHVGDRALATSSDQGLDLCPNCGIARRFQQGSRDACGDGYGKPGCFLASETDQEVPVNGTCKTDGCENAANTRYDRGPLHGLCEERCMPAKREEIGAKSKASRGKAAPAPDPGSTPVDPDPPARTLAQVAGDLEQAADALAQAERAHNDALEEFNAHPLVREMVGIGLIG